MRLLVSGGGTGGHVYPIVAVVQELAAAQTLKLESDVLFIGRGQSVEEKIAAKLGVVFFSIQAGGLRSARIRTQLRNARLLLGAARKASDAIESFKPDVALVTGGYVSAPVVWAAFRRKVPVVIELPDLEPGWAIRTQWRLSRQVAVSFERVLRYFPKGRATVTGYPVRAEFFRANRKSARAHFKLSMDLPVVTVFGGSQGAHVLNQAVARNLRTLVREIQVLHITGARDWSSFETLAGDLNPEERKRYLPFQYLEDDMALGLAAADLVVARAGAATLGEFPAVGVPSVLVPGAFAAGHQEMNADFMVEHGASVKLREERLESDLPSVVMNLLSDKKRLGEMASKARALAVPDAARRVGQLLVN